MTRSNGEAGAAVRVRTDAELDSAAAALVEVHRSDGYPVEGVVDPVGWLSGTSVLRAWIGELGGRVVGHVSVSSPQEGDAAAQMWVDSQGGQESPVAVLGRLFVSSHARGHALGSRLLREAMSYADDAGLRLVLDVLSKDAAAIALYERLGWKRFGSTVHRIASGENFPAYCYAGPSAH